MPDNEKQFEADIESYLISSAGGWQKATDAGYRSGFRCDNEGNFIENYALDIGTLCTFVKNTQPVAWNLFEKRCKSDPQAKFYRAFQNAVDMDGLINVLRHGFKHRGQEFRVVYFKPETELNQLSLSRYKENICQCIRQWHYSPRDTQNTVDMMLAVNGIPLVALELKDQLTGQTIDNAITQWMTNRDYREEAFQFNRRILTYFAVDLYHVAMSTRLLGTNTTFLPFNQGSNGPGVDGGAGNPQNPDGGYVTAYLWKTVLQKDKFLGQHRTIRRTQRACANVRQHAQKSLAIRQDSLRIFVQPDEIFDGAICARELCGAALRNCHTRRSLKGKWKGTEKRQG